MASGEYCVQPSSKEVFKAFINLNDVPDPTLDGSRVTTGMSGASFVAAASWSSLLLVVIVVQTSTQSKSEAASMYLSSHLVGIVCAPPVL
jgi:hypothetical protein